MKLYAAALRRLLPLLGLAGASLLSAQAQTGVGIGTTTPNTSAALDVNSTTKGLLPPRMSQAQRDAINPAANAAGLTVYNTTTGKLNVWNGTSWTESISTNEQPVPNPATTLNFTGGVQTYTVPAGVTSLTIDAVGAAGGRPSNITAPVGRGGRVQTTLAVTPGQVLSVYVGGQGGGSSTGAPAPGGYNGGGGTAGSAGAGGGATDIRTGGTALANRLVVAGGGGGVQYFNSSFGGNGGGLTGGNGSGSGGGTGGTQSAGGNTGGTLGHGGSTTVANSGNGAGGGGYYGGGAANGGGGGGGSSWVTPTGSSNTTHTQGYATGNGYITITPGPTYAAPALDGSNFVNVPGDHLGNHAATQNLNLGTNQLVGNGGTSGLSLSSTGVLTVPALASSGLLKATTSGTVTGAVAGTDYVTPTGNVATVTTNANLNGDITSVGNTTTYNNPVPNNKGGAGTLTGLLKATGGTVAAAVAGTDYVTPTSTAFVQNGTSPQPGSNFNISGAGTVGGLLTAGSATINGTTTVTGNETVSGTVGIGTTTPNTSAVLDVSSTTKGLLPPRMSQTQRNAVNPAATAAGLTVYNTTTGKLNVWNGTSWEAGLSASEQPYQGPPVTFAYTGGVQTYTVPAGVYSLGVDAAGASGGNGLQYDGTVASAGGNGARVQATLAVTPGEILTLYVGGAGTQATANGSWGGAGYNGGGNAFYNGSRGGGGGGASDLRRSPTAPSTVLSERLLVAAGGGGGSGGSNGGIFGPAGGAGGAPNGATGGTFQSTDRPGTGATQSAGGSIGGGFGQGGNSGSGGGVGGAGGGGYYGGGGSAHLGGGGGGSSWAAPTGSSGVAMTAGYQTGNGFITLTPAAVYAAPMLDGTNFVNLPAPNLTGDVTSNGTATTYNNVVPATKGGAGTVSGLLKANGSGTVAAAVAGTDYAAASGSASYIQNGTGQQPSSNFNISGAGTVGGLLTAGSAAVAGNATVSGNVGIGTTAPTQKLDVFGNARVGSANNAPGKVLTQATGSNNMLAVAYGLTGYGQTNYSTTGGTAIYQGTGNFTVAHPSIGKYIITFPASSGLNNSTLYTVQVSLYGAGGAANGFIYFNSIPGAVEVYTSGTNGALNDFLYFSFTAFAQ